MNRYSLGNLGMMFGMVAFFNQGIALAGSPMPVRIPRANLSQEPRVVLQISVEGQSPVNIESGTFWEEMPTTLPAPSGPYMADYRDYFGCLHFRELENVSLCFNVMPDVSSVGVNRKDMSIQGLPTYIENELRDKKSQERMSPAQIFRGKEITTECEMQTPQFQLVGAEWINGDIYIQYSGEIRKNGKCATSQQPIQVILKFPGVNPNG